MSLIKSRVNNYLYHVTFGGVKKKVVLTVKSLESLRFEIGRQFGVENWKALKIQAEDDDFPGEIVDVTSNDELPDKAKILASVGL